MDGSCPYERRKRTTAQISTHRFSAYHKKIDFVHSTVETRGRFLLLYVLFLRQQSDSYRWFTTLIISQPQPRPAKTHPAQLPTAVCQPCSKSWQALVTVYKANGPPSLKRTAWQRREECCRVHVYSSPLLSNCLLLVASLLRVPSCDDLRGMGATYAGLVAQRSQSF